MSFPSYSGVHPPEYALLFGHSFTICRFSFINLNKSFAGINISNYEINIESSDNEFEKNELYESYIIGKQIKDIRRKILNDNVKITNFIGKRGIIDINEYKLKK